MNRNLFWKFLLVVFVVAWSIRELYPPMGHSLIEEFAARGPVNDTNFTAIVDRARELEKQYPDRTYQNVLEAVGTNQIAGYFPGIDVSDAEDPTREVLQQLQRDASGNLKLGLDLQGGSSFLVGMDTNKLAEVLGEDRERDRDQVLAQAVEVLRQRVDRFGVAEPVIQPAGANRILIQLPGLTEAEKEAAREQIQRAAFLEFRMVHPESEELLNQGLGAPGYEILRPIAEGREGRGAPLLVSKQPEQGLTGKYVDRASVVPEPMTGQPEIVLVFNDDGARLFSEVTRNNVGRRLAIVLDGQLYSAPVIRGAIPGGRASISGDFTIEEAFTLANVLENPLEAPVKIEQENSVEPSLGKDSIRSGFNATVIALILVLVFMLGYYLLAGVMANVALLLNLVILLGVVASLDATLTLPGIAGIVLTMGMAVDANVLIFERIREELRAGKSLRGSVSAGYDKAFGTIFDSNVTTLIASVILIFLGTGPVKGFGVTLTIGICVSLFTALFVTRLMFDFLLAREWLKKLPMLRVIGATKIDFLRFSKPAFLISWILVAVGVGYGISRGQDVLGVDFAGGDRLLIEFEEKVAVGAVRDAIAGAGMSEPLISYQTDLATGEELLQITTEFEKGPQAMELLQEQYPNAQFQVVETLAVGPTVGQEILKAALAATLLALFGILVYVALRYEFSFAMAAVIAVVHDVLMTVGWFCLTGREFSAPMVAAILTIIGFSMNDTIVVFDRIREDLRLGVRGSFRDLMNHALNLTLSRTIITSGTTFFATLALYIFGGPVINDFAFTFMVGIITGTFSTIYIAGAVVLWWTKGERPKLAPSTVQTEGPGPGPAPVRA